MNEVLRQEKKFAVDLYSGMALCGRLGSVIMELDGKYMSFTETEREAVKPRKRRRAYDDD